MGSNKTVVVFSGGMDSTTLLYGMRAIGRQVIPLGIDYGQRHRKELEAAAKICWDLHLPYQIADLRALRSLLGGSSQTDDTIAVPEGHYAEESMKKTVVPNRNMILLSVAIARAISAGADQVAYGAHAGDHAIYPDCRPEFVMAMRHVAKLADWSQVEIVAPFLDKTKADIARQGKELGVPFELTWSCYKGGDVHCGKCGTCVERREAFLVAGVTDPTTYETAKVAR